MPKTSRRIKRESLNQGRQNFTKAEPANSDIDTIEFQHASMKPIEALTQTQEFHKSALIHDDIVVAIGSAGTGKTYLASAVAAELMKSGRCKRIIMTRPNIEVGKSLGYLPGELDDKYAPFLEPFKKGLIDRLGSNKFKCDYKRTILAKPLQYMRGDTFDNAILLLDEAQNTTVADMKMFLTRVGINSKIFITGDVNQTDLGTKDTGLAWLIRQIRARNQKIEIIQYSRDECVRSDLCKEMLDMIENEV